MALKNYIKNLFFSHDHKVEQKIPVETQKLFSYLKSLVNKKELIYPEEKSLERVGYLSDEERRWAFVQVYYLFEAFLIENKPPVTIETLNKKILHQKIKERVDIDKLDENLRIILLPEREKVLNLYQVFIKPLSQYIKTKLGSEKLEKIILNSNQGRFFDGIKVNDRGLSFDEFNRSILSNEKIVISEVTAIFKRLYGVLYEEIRETFGRDISDRLVEGIYFKVKRSYEYNIVASFLEALPPHILESERVSYLSRNDLEETILERTKELKEEKERVEQKVKERTADLEYEKNKLSAITSNMNEGAILLDEGSNVVFINRAAKRFLNMGDETEVVTEEVWRSFAKKFPNIEIKSSFSKCQSDKSYIIPEYEVRPEEIYKISFNVLSGKEGKRKTSFIWVEDITESKLLERKKSEFIAVAAHQLRTPLSGLKWMLHMIINEELGPLSSDQKAFLMKSYESNERMIVLVNEMLGASRIESGKLNISPVSLSLPNLIDNILVEVRAQAKERGVEIIFEKSGNDEPKVFADPEKIRAVLQNLIENALKYTMKDGFIQIDMEDKDGSAVVSVKDNGIGIPESDRDKIFGRFFRSKNAVRIQTDGSGLGLFVAKNIVEKHKGHIWFESEENKGTTFYFTLPKKQI